jgi:hypothetical protein
MPIPESPARQVAYHGNERNSTAAARATALWRGALRVGEIDQPRNQRAPALRARNARLRLASSWSIQIVVPGTDGQKTGETRLPLFLGLSPNAATRIKPLRHNIFCALASETTRRPCASHSGRGSMAGLKKVANK